MSGKHQLIAATCFGSLIVGSTIATATSNSTVRVSALHPFTHQAYIIADADLSSIKFEGIKAVKTPLKQRTDNRYCEDRFAEPGGSIDCPLTTNEAPAPAYRVSYSFKGQPLPSDETRGTRFTFSVLFHPEELGAWASRASAENFAIATSRGRVQQKVIDEAKSTFCETVHHDGNWTPRDRNCRDKVVYKTVMLPSPYVTVTVTPICRTQAGLQLPK